MFQVLFKKLWPAIPGAILTALFAWWLHGAAMDRATAAHAADLAAQAAKLTAQCKTEKAITEGVANDYQKKLLALKSQHHALRVQRPAACVPILKSASPASGTHGATKAGKLAGSNGHGRNRRAFA